MPGSRWGDTRAEDIREVLDKMDEQTRDKIGEVTLDLSDSMRKIERHSPPSHESY